MEPARVSGIVTVEDQRSYIKIETLRGKNPTEIHSALREVCGDYQIFWESRGLERGPLSLVRTIKGLLKWKSNGSGLENRD
jgi:hypothetical protein